MSRKQEKYFRIKQQRETKKSIRQQESKLECPLCETHFKDKDISCMLAMGMHTRIGKQSPLQMIDSFIARTIVHYVKEQCRLELDELGMPSDTIDLDRLIDLGLCRFFHEHFTINRDSDMRNKQYLIIRLGQIE